MSGKVDLKMLQERHVSLERWAAGLNSQTVTMARDDFLVVIRQGRVALERAERVEAAARPLAERCWNRRVVAVRDPDEVAWTTCGICPPCKLRAALEAEA